MLYVWEELRLFWPRVLLGLLLLTVLVWLIVRFWRLKPPILLAFSGLWLAGGAVLMATTTRQDYNYWGGHPALYFLGRLLANEISAMLILLFALLVSLLALIRSTVGDRKQSPDTATVEVSQQDADNE